MTQAMANTARMTCCALAAVALAATVADARPKKARAKPAEAATTATTSHDRPSAATFSALPKLPPVADVSDAAQTGGTSAANQTQIKRQVAYAAAEQARQAKINADLAAYAKTELAYKRTMEAWNKQGAACRAGDAAQCGPAPAAGK